ncbi:hypothetical protein FQN54_004707 [Arachnomyces sp. PD_36]|nr:hypothetical protein FQN54_004707 [Arachnomyces sp. PD_36]
MSNTANVKRALWRTKCRERLSRHIKDELGITVSPEEIRLKSTSDDGYRWKVKKPGKRLEALFTKHLSEHSTRAYMQLCEEVEKNTFYAASADETETVGVIGSDSNDICDRKLENNAQYWKKSAEDAAATIRELETQLENIRAENDKLQRIARNYCIKARLLQNRTADLETHLESHAGELFKLTDTFKKGIAFRPPSLPTNIEI